MSNKKRVVKRRKAGPRYQGIGLAISEDGLNFENLNQYLTKYGGVPCLITAPDGTVIASYQYFDPRRRPITLVDGTSIAVYFGGMAISKSIDGGKKWTPYTKIRFKGLSEEDGGRACDPAIVILPDKRMRLYFTARARTLSAISDDYEIFEVEEGVRFVDENRMVLDPAVIKIGDKWHYYAPYHNDSNRNYHAVSEDGLNFKHEPDIVGEGLRFLGNVCVADNGYRFYTTYKGVSSAFSKDGYEWTVEPEVRLSGSDVAGDVGVTRLVDGTYLMAYTTKALRADPFDRP